MPGPLRAPIKAHRKRLLHPLHDRRKPQPAKLEGKALSRLTKYPAENRYRLPPPEQGLAVIDRRPHLIPGIIHQNSLLSRIVYMGFFAILLQSNRKKVREKRKKAIIIRRKE
jgi:hypothetical protein